MNRVSLDFETRSAADLPKVGTHRYAEDPSTEVLCVAFRFNRDPETHLWHPGFPELPCDDEPLRELAARALDGWEFWAFNAMFERQIWEKVLRRYRRWIPEVPHESWRCSAALAATYALPRRLEDIAAALGVPVQKDMVGHRLVMRMSKPRKPTKADPHSRWHQPTEDLLRLFAYCRQDVLAECAVADQLRPLPPDELAAWQLDQAINMRGVTVDRAMANAALEHAKAYRRQASEKVKRITRGSVPSVTRRRDLITWVQQDRGVDLPDSKKETLDALLDGDTDVIDLGPLPGDVEEVLTIWRAANRTSTAKYAAMLRRVCADDRIRDLLRYHGASTGRWAGQGIQPQNFPRGTVKGSMDDMCRDIAQCSMEELGLIWGDQMDLLSSALRGALMAGPGNELIAGDYSAIEARGTFWLAGDDDALSIFEQGLCIYRDMAGQIYLLPDPQSLAKSSPERQMGKQAVLGLGYQMGPPKFRVTVKRATGLTIELAFAKSVVDAYRAKYWRVKALWEELEYIAIKAIEGGQGSMVQGPRGVAYGVRGDFLHCRLPSGRLLSYYRPWIEMEPFIWTDPETGEKKDLGLRPKIKFMGVDTYTKKWSRQTTYGGKLTENVVQALSRDVMWNAMPKLEAAGYPTILTVHDEIVSEVPKGYGDDEEYERIMAERPAWAADMPIEVEVWRAVRYRK